MFKFWALLCYASVLLCFSLFRLEQHGFCAGAPTEIIEAGGEQLPWLDPYKAVCWLAEQDRLELLHGGIDLMEFWRRFAKYQPDHPIFQQGENYARLIPLLSHGDEGREKKKRGIMIWSMKGVAGSGTKHFRNRPESEQRSRMPLNLDNSLRSRFLHAAVPTRFYKDNAACWFQLAEHIGKAYYKLQLDGFEYKGQVWKACLIALTGDAPFLAKAACLNRSFSRVAKAAESKSGNLPGGICFACLAGTLHYPFEDLGSRPKWLETVNTAPAPWDADPPFLKALGSLRPTMLQYDSCLKYVFSFEVSIFLVASCVSQSGCCVVL